MDTIQLSRSDVIDSHKLLKHIEELYTKIAELQAQIDALKGK